MADTVKKRKLLKGKHKDLIFYSLMMLFPIAQFCVFYIGVNFNSFLLSFQNIDLLTGKIDWTFDNITRAFTLMTTSKALLSALSVSVLSYFILLGIGTPLGLLFSYYIYKKLPLSGAFRVLLFLPSIISAIVMVTIFQFFVERAIPAFASQLFGIKMKGLLENVSTRFATIIFYNIWVGFGTSVLMYSNGMSGISNEVVESAHLDGATGFKEFWHITLPGIRVVLGNTIITCIMASFQQFTIIYNMTAGGPLGKTTTLSIAAYKQAFTQLDLGAGSAIGVIWMMLLGAAIAIYNMKTKRFDEL